VLSKSLAKQEARHFEPLAGEKSAHFSRRPRRLNIFALCLFTFTFQKCSKAFLEKQTHFQNTKNLDIASKSQKWRPKS
jgi:hypothetical protein